MPLYPGTYDPLMLGAAFSFPPLANDPTVRAVNTVSEAVYVRLVGAGTFANVAIRVGTASGNICAGVYLDTIVGGVHQPGARVATTGSVACPASGSATIALDGSVTVTHGSHWFAFSADNVTATFVVQNALPMTEIVIFPGNCYVQATAFPLPNPAASLSAAGRRFPLMRGV